MRLPKYDVLLPVLFVAVIFPMLAGGWWRFFSGHADQVMNLPVQVQPVVANMGNAPLALPARYRSEARPAKRPVQMLSGEESPLTQLLLNDDPDE